jgi:hypothetical protein
MAIIASIYNIAIALVTTRLQYRRLAAIIEGKNLLVAEHPLLCQGIPPSSSFSVALVPFPACAATTELVKVVGVTNKTRHRYHQEC